MAEEHDDVLELTERVEDQEEAAEANEISIEIEGDEDTVEEKQWLKDLRKRERDLARENASLRKAQQPDADIVVGEKPTMESCEYDETRYDRERDAYEDRKRAAAKQTADRESAAGARNASFDRAMETYRGQAVRLGVKDFDKAEAAVMEALPDAVKETVVRYFKEPAKLVAALGKSPSRLDQIASEPDQMRMLLALKELEGSIKVVNKRRPPEPESETIQRGSAPVSRQNDAKKLEALEKEAARTGNRTPIIEYNRALRAKENAK